MNFLRVLLKFTVMFIAYAILHSFLVSLNFKLYDLVLFISASIEIVIEISCSVVYCCGAYMHSGITALRVIEHGLPEELFGQPVALHSIQETFRKNFENFTLGVPLSLHLSGPTGTGKSHVCKLIAESMYTKGLESKIVHKFEGKDLFRNEEEREYYQNSLRNWIQGNLTLCDRSMFIFENVEKMPPEFLEVTRPFLYGNMGGLFIFTTTKVNPEIIALHKKLRNEGVKKSRYPVAKYKHFDETMTYSTAKYLIARNERNYRISLKYTNDEHLVLDQDREYRLRTTAQAIFLPLEHRELKFCMLDEFERLGKFVPSDCELQKVYDIMDYENHRDDLVSCKDVIQITQWVVNNGDC